MVLLIGGHMRSGTTLLWRLCNTHPDIALTNEFNYFSGLGKAYIKHSRPLLKRLWKQTIRRQIRLAQLLRNYAFVTRYLFNLQRHRDGLIDGAAIEATLRSIFPKARIVGDKQPYYAFLLDEFAAINGLSWLIIFRDCRDVTSSMLERYRTKWHKNSWMRKYYNTAEKVAKHWVHSIETMERYRDKIHIIRYEDLVQEPRRELEALAKWLGVDCPGFSESIISNIRNTDIGTYKTGLTDEELDTVMKIAGPTMARLGYI